MPNTSPPPTTHLQSLRLFNFRCFKTFEIDFHPKLTVLSALNGQGKTALLDAIAVSLRPFVDGMEGRKNSKGFDRTDTRRIVTPSGKIELAAPVRIEVPSTDRDGKRHLHNRRLRSP